MDRMLNAKALGVEDALKNENEEMPGDITIKGDETHYHYDAPAQPTQQVIQQTPTNQPPTTNAPQQIVTTGIRRWLLPACIGFTLLGAGGAMLVNYFSKAPAVVQAINNLGIKPGVQVSDKP